VPGGAVVFDPRNVRAQCGEYLCSPSLYIGSEGSESREIILAIGVRLPVVGVMEAVAIALHGLRDSIIRRMIRLRNRAVSD
jgi:hypothetical protein